MRSASIEDLREGRAPQVVLGIPENTPTSIVVWRGDLFIGTAGGKVLSARKA